MQYHRLYTFLLLLLLTLTNINSLPTLTKQKSDDIQLKAPNNLGAIYYDNRQALQLLPDITEKEGQLEVISDSGLTDPCNGSYIKTNGTTCGLKEIMIGRCYDYQFVKRGLYLSDQTELKNCTELYELFESAVLNKSHCSVTINTYEKYFERALKGVHVINRAMFWSGTYVIAHTYSNNGMNYITLEDTLASGMVNGLRWCGKENGTKGFNYAFCPGKCENNKWADSAFWELASKTFAERAAGEIYVVLNGSRTDGQPTFRNTSIFAEFELPNFQRNGSYPVTKVHVLLLHSPDQQVVERCGEKSLITLENLVRNSQFEYTCKDDPEEIILVMCGADFDARECQIARKVLRQAWDVKVFGQSNANYHSISFLLLFSLLFNYFL